MKKTTKLIGLGNAGKIEVIIKTDSKDEKLSKDESEREHNLLASEIHKAMTDCGCFAHQIDADPQTEF